MKLGVKPSDIQHEDLRATLEGANQSLDAGQYRLCVEKCAEAYLAALTQFPRVLNGLNETLTNPQIKAGIEARIVRVAPYMWPRFVAKLDVSGVEARIVFDRDHASFTEAIAYYEFTLNLIHEAEKV
ncbi:MAG TPA: hypothetical protein VMW65_14200 [Chloroflexota bacterium]|nr:hypothetical protein [Chloroflexota bacterium]